MVGLIDVHSSWLMTGKSMMSIAALIGKKLEYIGRRPDHVRRYVCPPRKQPARVEIVPYLSQLVYQYARHLYTANNSLGGARIGDISRLYLST